jgi:hypothetical protein
MNFHSRLTVEPATPRKRRPHIVLTGRNLAHADRGPWERAFLAAAWVRGGVTLTDPTLKMAAKVFDVSVATLGAALNQLAGTEHASAHDAIWAAMTPTERADLFRDHLTEVWTALEMATAA